MEILKGKFWTSEEEMIEEIENTTNFDVMNVDYSEIEVMDREGWDDKIEAFELVRAGKTIAIKLGGM